MYQVNDFEDSLSAVECAHRDVVYELDIRIEELEDELNDVNAALEIATAELEAKA